MEADLKREWAEALRSGDYVQGNNFLHYVPDNTWCCLGVLCDVLAKRGQSVIAGWTWSSELGQWINAQEDDSRTGVLPEAGAGATIRTGVRARLGLSVTQQQTLIDMNDGHGEIYKGDPVPFPKIADWIEQNL